MVEYIIDCDDSFKKLYVGLDNSLKIKVRKQINKIRNNPLVGKPMRHLRKGTREVYVMPYRLSYYFNKDDGIIILLDLYHKDKQ